jgi:hypothetical protein
MYQAITTRYLGPSNVRGARVKAFAEAGSLTFSWDHALNSEENHCKAARAFAEKYGWKARYVGGCVAGRDYVWCGEYHTSPSRDGVDVFDLDQPVTNLLTVTSKNEEIEFHHVDNGNYRVYFIGTQSRRLYCIHLYGHKRDGSDDFRLYVCSRDGEPSHEINQHTLGDLGELYRKHENAA